MKTLFRGVVKGKVYCRHEGEHSQSYLEGVRLNMASRLNRSLEERESGGAMGKRAQEKKRGERMKPGGEPEVESKPGDQEAW